MNRLPKILLIVLLLLSYNLLFIAVVFFFLPVIIAFIFAVPKRRYTFFQRFFCRRYDWESEKPDTVKTPVIWVHALSVGEVTAAEPVVEHLKRSGRFGNIVVSASTHTGFQTAQRLFKNKAVRLIYFPYDLLWPVRKIVAKIKPDAVILIETDIWPNFQWEMSRRKIPVFLANIRISDSTWKAYKRVKLFVKPVFSTFKMISVQTDLDKRRFIKLGIEPENIRVLGNIKFDASFQAQSLDETGKLRRKLGIGKRHHVIVAGSTHQGEEEILLDGFLKLSQKHTNIMLIIAPRNPRRADQILALCKAGAVSASCLSTMTRTLSMPGARVIVVDSLGVLKNLYPLASICFVGGSLAPFGGHNPLEPAACSKPVVFGPDMRDFFQIAAWLTESGAAKTIHCAQEMVQVIGYLLENQALARDMGRRAYEVYISQKGVVKRTLSCFGIGD